MIMSNKIQKHITLSKQIILSSALTISIILCSTGLLFGQSSKITKVPINTRSNGTSNNPAGYVEYLPTNYDSRNDWPVLIWFHGLGENGDGSASDLDKIANRQIMNWLKNNDVPFIVLAPQDAYGQFYDGLMQEIYQWSRSKYGSKSDEAQWHIQVLSASGGGMKNWLQAATPDLSTVNSITLSASILNTSGFTTTKYNNIINSGVRLWFHHGVNDNTVQIGGQRGFYKNIVQTLGGYDFDRYRFTAYTGLGHSAWNKVYNNSGRTSAKSTGIIYGGNTIVGDYYNWTTESWYDWMTGSTNESQPIPTVNAGTDETLNLPTNSINITGSASSNGGTISSYQWSKINGPSTFTINNSKTKTVSLSGLVAGVYTFRLTATDGLGQTGSDDVKVTVNSENQNSNRIVKINFTDGSLLGGAGWNNTAGHPNTGDQYSGLADQYGNSTTISLILSDWTNGGSNNAGQSTGNNSGVYNDNILKSTYWTYTNPESFIIKGLDDNKKYDLTFLGSRNANDNRTTKYTVGSQTATLNAASNTENTVTIDNLSASNGIIEVQVSRGTGSTYGYINALVLTEEPESNMIPAAPELVTLNFDEANGKIDMEWSDQASNESAYRIYKAEDSTNFSLLTELPQNTESFSDSLIQAGTTFTYEVAAVNEQGENASAEVSVTIPNIAPVLKPIDDQLFEIGNEYSISVHATDAISDSIKLSTSKLPSFAQFIDRGNGNGTVNFAPQDGENGEYEIVVKATDQNNLESQISFTVVVNSQLPHSYLINFAGISSNNQSGWNNFVGTGLAGHSLNNISAVEANKPTLTLDLLDSWGGNNSAGMTGSSVFPDKVSRSCIWVEDITDKKIRIAGLAPDNTYDFEFFGSRNGSGNRTTFYTINGTSVSLNASYNKDSTVKVDSIQPSENGEIIITVNKANEASYGYLNALKISGYKVGSNPTIASRVENSDASIEAVQGSSSESVDQSQTEATTLEQELSLKLVGSFRVYPNPYLGDYGFLTLYYDGNTEEKFSIKIIDSSGKIIRRLKNVVFNSSHEKKISDLNSLTNGLYLIQVQSKSTGLQTFRVLKK